MKTITKHISEYVCERNKYTTGHLVFTDLRAHQLCHLSVVAVEHILQAQPERGGKVKNTQTLKTIKHTHTHTQSKAPFSNVFYKHTQVDTWPTERLLLWYGMRDCLTSYLQALKTLTGRRSWYTWNELFWSSPLEKKHRVKYCLLLCRSAASQCVVFFNKYIEFI